MQLIIRWKHRYLHGWSQKRFEEAVAAYVAELTGVECAILVTWEQKTHRTVTFEVQLDIKVDIVKSWTDIMELREKHETL